MATYQDLGPYSDLVDAARARQPARDGGGVRAALGFDAPDAAAADVRVEATWERDGLVGEELTWSVGYGPRAAATFVKPAGATGPLPGVVALHCHGGFMFYGREKVVDGLHGCPPVLAANREGQYGGVAFANRLAEAGFAVLAPDVFCWGSRRFPVETMPKAIQEHTAILVPGADEVTVHNTAARLFEHVVEKYCVLLGTSMAGVVAAEDRMAVEYLASRPDVRDGQLGCVGLSGGGARSALLQATSEWIGAAVVVGMMSTYEGLLDHNVAGHTWMFFPGGWARQGDWPDLAAARAPSPLLVQYDRDDSLFTMDGMQAAHAKLQAAYGESGAYEGRFYDGPHKFDLEMQDDATAWLTKQLSA